MRTVFFSALTTGAFCAGFATIIDTATNMLDTYQVAIMGAISGFLGSLFASLIWKRWK